MNGKLYKLPLLRTTKKLATNLYDTTHISCVYLKQRPYIRYNLEHWAGKRYISSQILFSIKPLWSLSAKKVVNSLSTQTETLQLLMH
jgi:hypothetical protein